MAKYKKKKLYTEFILKVWLKPNESLNSYGFFVLLIFWGPVGIMLLDFHESSLLCGSDNQRYIPNPKGFK